MSHSRPPKQHSRERRLELALERRRGDAEFQSRIKEMMKENAKVLKRLAG